MKELEEKQKDILQEAQQSFWAVIAEAHPEITTGDFPPDAAFAFDEACEKAHKIWIEGNTPCSIFTLNPKHDYETADVAACDLQVGDVLFHTSKCITIIQAGNRRQLLRTDGNSRSSSTILPYKDSKVFTGIVSLVRDEEDILFKEIQEYKAHNNIIEHVPSGQKRSENICPACDYDMGHHFVNCGASEDGVCPECSTDIDTPTCKVKGCGELLIEGENIYCYDCYGKADRHIVVITTVNLHERKITDEQLNKHAYDIYANMADGPLDGDDLGGDSGSVFKTKPTIVDNDKK